ncbi:MAG TPA: SAM-dependent methyltransferase [Bryobacteraceae bacterium]|nr:SAM-dependent methyltransferase [Bryobacteraceae bacterium]
MQLGEPSRTAQGAAFHRAAHQVLEQGRIFADPLALRILGLDAATVLQEVERRRSGHGMRLFIAARTRFAEDWLAAAAARGVRQLVVLGAGLDTYAYRGALRDRLRVFEVDYPATQTWKRERLAEAGIPLPACLTFAPVDFERQTLAGGLQAAGFDTAQPTFFTWLGVVPYLTAEAVWSTLGFIACLPNGAHVVFDYADPPESLPPEIRARHDRRAARVAGLGEPWINYSEPAELHARLRTTGFSAVEDLGPPEIAARYLGAIGPVPSRGGHILYAATV